MSIGKFHKVQIVIDGLYGWGRGWLGEDYPARWWSALCEFQDGNRENTYMGGYCDLKCPTNGGKCAEFIGPRSYAYMHPMEVIIETSETYVTEYSTVRKDLMDTSEKFLEFIMEKFEDVKNVGGRITLKSYPFDMDHPEKTVKVINND
jgi:hypothetical protein